MEWYERLIEQSDLNLSEAIQRVPGVALARDAGEGRQISVRGLGAQFKRHAVLEVLAESVLASTSL